MFNRLIIKDWRQFEDIDIVFHPHLTVLTGANGAGKTTILNLLSQSIGWTPQFVSSYEKDDRGVSKYFNSLKKIGKKFFIKKTATPAIQVNKFGELEFTDKSIADLILPETINSGIYSITPIGGKKEKGVYINSHRPSFPYRAVKTIPTTIATREQIFQKYNEFSKKFVYDSYRDSDKLSATTLIKETIASLALFGYGNQAVAPNETARKLLEGYVEILKIVLPPKLEFEDISVIVPEVILRTKTGAFPIDAASGGISSIIDITWQLYMFADRDESFIVLIDEPENHLHPELQRTFLGNLIKAFPSVQFVVATHNPFMITAEKDSNVFVLDYNDQHRVCSCQLDYINRAGTSNVILREVLGIDSTMPIWAEKTLDTIISKYSKTEFTHAVLEELKQELAQIGLADYIPASIVRIVEERDR